MRLIHIRAKGTTVVLCRADADDALYMSYGAWRRLTPEQRKATPVCADCELTGLQLEGIANAVQGDS